MTGREARAGLGKEVRCQQLALGTLASPFWPDCPGDCGVVLS